jgi:7,8-dihydroneopterin aldolase/epimerase/oxygenase
MGIITLNKIRCYAFHGCLKEEGIIGSDYLVNLKVKANLKKSSETDDLNDTVDYVKLNQIVVNEMNTRSKLLEEVAQRILCEIFKELSMVEKAWVEVSKINPPLGGDVEMVTIKLSKKR